jgi:hypothetical protein
MTESVIASLIAAFIFGALVSTWNSFIVPFFVENFGERIKLYRVWSAYLDFGSGNLHGVKLNIIKLGYRITGVLEYTTGRHTGKKYFVYGRFQSNILTFHYYPEDKHSTSQGSATFKRLNDGELLQGYFSYYSQDKDLIDTVACEFIPTKK